MAKAKTKRGKRRVKRSPGTWVVLARAYNDCGYEMWNAAAYDERDQLFSGGKFPSRQVALVETISDAIEQRGTPDRILVEPEVIASGELAGYLGLAPTGDEQEEVIARFEREVRRYERLVEADPDEEEAAAAQLFAEFVDAAGRTIAALDGEEARVLARVRMGPLGQWFAMVCASAEEPSVVVCDLDDAAPLHLAMTTGAPPPVRTIALVFRGAREVAPAMPAAMRAAGWRHPRLPCLSAFERGEPVEPSEVELDEMTVLLGVLVDAGLASAVRGTTAGTVEPSRGVAVEWETVAVREEPRVLH